MSMTVPRARGSAQSQRSTDHRPVGSTGGRQRCRFAHNGTGRHGADLASSGRPPVPDLVPGYAASTAGVSALAEQFILLIDGAIVTSLREGSTEAGIPWKAVAAPSLGG